MEKNKFLFFVDSNGITEILQIFEKEREKGDGRINKRLVY